MSELGVQKHIDYTWSTNIQLEKHIGDTWSASDQLARNLMLVFRKSTFASQLSQKDNVHIDIQQLLGACEQLQKWIENVEKYHLLSTRLKAFQVEIKKLEALINAPQDTLNKALEEQLEQAFTENFQVNALSKLKNKNISDTGDTRFYFGEAMGDLQLKSNYFQCNLKVEGVDVFQKIDNVVYLESPVYWTIKDVLKDWVQARSNPDLRRQVKHQQKELKKVPGYILDTFRLLDTEIVIDKTFDDLVQLKQQIDKNISGYIQVSERGDLRFINQREDKEGYDVDLHQAASGSISLGIIALLLGKNIIVPNSVLIIDEPEINLHPAWQQVMIQALYQLSVAGVHVIMASHSYDMMQCIEKMMDSHEKKGLDVNEHFSVQQLENGTSINENKPIFKKLDSVKADLGMPLFDLFSNS
ncbi:MAG: AAA family ATPase [Methyloprofundus sp.]|nr:AAA family ATPase [Methyloprofundus sp.]